MLADSTPPAVAFNATPADATARTDITASVTLSIAGEQFTLSGSLADNQFVIEYHADFDKAINLGTISDIAGEIGTALSFPTLGDEITKTLSGLKGVPVLSEVAQVVDAALIRITDLVINTKTKTYGVGIAFDFAPPPKPGTTPTPPPHFLGITLLSFGFTITRVSPS